MRSVHQEENRNARFTKAATSSYLVDVSQMTQSFARCVGLVGRLGLGGARAYGLFASHSLQQVN